MLPTKLTAKPFSGAVIARSLTDGASAKPPLGGRSKPSAHGPRQSLDAAAKAPWLFPHIRGPRSVLQDRTRGPLPTINKVLLGPLRSGKGALASASERSAGAARDAWALPGPLGFPRGRRIQKTA